MAQPFYMEYETRYNKMQGCIDSYKHPRSRKGLYAKGLKTRAPKKLSNKYIIERANKK